MYSDRIAAKLGEPLSDCAGRRAGRWRDLDLVALGEAVAAAGRLLAQRFPELGEHQREDAVADAQLRLLERVAQGVAPSYPRKFLCGTALRLAARSPRESEISQARTASSPLAVEDFTDQLIAALDLRLELAEQRELSSAEAVAWQLRMLAGLSLEAIAERMHCCRDTVYRRVRAASDKLASAADSTKGGE